MENKKKMNESQSSKKISKSGMRILKKDVDLFELFTGEKSEKEAKENFTKMLKDSLSGKDLQNALHEKQDDLSLDKPITMTERIKDFPPPEDELNLHGYTAKEAEAKTEYFIESAHKMGIKTVRIITGKGLHSQGKAVLPDVIQDKIVDLKRRKLILTFQWENRYKLKSGAIIAYLT
ncbi:MAG: Smr/MutS family protein [Thermodesulfobacteriota bacterium]|nr:Smr/MutS family protein [Thermodesulfobacteriota bacterium]